MLPALAFLLLTTLPGVWLCGRLSGVRGLAERTGLAMATGLLLQLWLPFVTSRLFGMRNGPWVALVLVALGVLVLGNWLREEKKMPAWRPTLGLFLRRLRSRKFTLNATFLLSLSLFLGWLFYTHSLAPKPQGLTSAGVSWEDQSYHAMLASSFLWSDNLQAMEYPHFTGWPLGYPFLADFLAATLAGLGATLGQAFWWSAWYAGIAFLLLAWSLARLWLGTGGRASLAILLLLTTGGAGWLDFLGEWRHGTRWPEVLMKHDYADGWELGLHYHNMLTGVLLPMRTSLIGMPVALAIILMLTRLAAPVKKWRLDLLVAGVMAGLLPLVHAHSFLVVCAVVMTYFFFLLPRREWLVGALWFLPPLLLLALPQIQWTRSQMAISDPFIRIHLGWMYDPKEGNWLLYWLHNGGLRLPLGLACWFFAEPRVRKWTLPLLAWLLIGNVVLFQPFAYDNIKFFAFADLALSALAVLALAGLWRRSWRGRWLVVPLFLLLTAAGLLSIWRETRLTSTITDWEAVDFAEMVRISTPPRAVFLTSSELTHPVPVLTGRPLVQGYKSWLVQHGVPLVERENDVREIFHGGPRAGELLKKYHVAYVVIGPPEKREYPDLSEAFFARLSDLTLSSGPYTLYRLRAENLR